MTAQSVPQVAVGPDDAPDWIRRAVEDGGGQVVALADAEALVWAGWSDPDALAAAVEAAPSVEWVQLPWAGIEPFLGVIDDERTWTCGKGVYADPVAELALTLGLTGLRGVHTYAQATGWTEQGGRNLLGGRVTIVGGGGIAESLIRLLQPFDCHVTVVRQNVEHMDGVDDVVGADHLADALPGADLVVLALALTPETEGLIGADELALMEPHAWLVNVARGRHVVTDDLVDGLRAGAIGGAGLEVTDPEPLPDGHPLWSIENCVITPHTGTTRQMAEPLLAARVAENVARYGSGRPLLGLVDTRSGY